MKKNIIILALCTVIGLCSCNQQKSNSSEEDSQSEEMATSESEPLEFDNGSQNSIMSSPEIQAIIEENMTRLGEGKEFNKKVVGKYEFSDKFNKWELTVNEDKTCTIVNKSKGGNTIGYGSWDSLGGKSYSLSFKDMVPEVWFDGNDDFVGLSHPEISSDLEYIYENHSAREAKNPRKRLKITKIK